jgi:hypothetical protein
LYFTNVANFTNLSLLYTGVTNIIGRLGAGFVASIPKVNSLVLHNASLLLMGFTLVGIMFCRTFTTMCIAAVFFGLGMGE